MSSPLYDLDGSRELANRYQRALDLSPNLRNYPSFTSDAVNAGLSDNEMVQAGGFLDAQEAASKVSLARASGAKVTLTSRDRSLLDAEGVAYSDVDASLLRNVLQYIEPGTMKGSAQANNALDVGAKGLNWFEQGVNKAADVSADLGMALIQAPGISHGLKGLAQGYEWGLTPFRAGIAAGKQAWDSTFDDGSEKRWINSEMLRYGYDPTSLVSAIAFYAKGDHVYNDLTPLAEEFGQENLDLARMIRDHFDNAYSSTQASVESYLASQGNLSDAALAGLVEKTSTPQFEELMGVLGDYQISIGREVARAVVDEGSEPFQWISGSVDAAVAWYADPFIVLGRVAQGVRHARRGLVNGLDTTGIQRILDPAVGDKAVRAGWQSFLDDSGKLATANASGDAAESAALFAGMNIRHKPLMPMLDEILGRRWVNEISPTTGKPIAGSAVQGAERVAPITTMDDLTTYLVNTNAFLRLGAGLAPEKSLLMPGRVSRWAETKAAAAESRTRRGITGQKPIDHTNPLRNLADDGDDLAARAGEKSLEYNLTRRGRAAKKVKRMSTLMPEGSSLRYGDAASTETVRRFSALFMSKPESNLIASRWSTATEAERRALFDGIAEQTVHAAGLGKSVSGRAFIESYRGQRKEFADAMYAHGGYDEFLDASAEGGKRRSAVTPGQLEDSFHLPNIRDLLHASSKAAVNDRFYGGMFQSAAMDNALTGIRLGWLLKSATGIRNTVEELGATLATGRFGETARVRGLMSKNNIKMSENGKATFEPRIAEKYREMAVDLPGTLMGSLLSAAALLSKKGRTFTDDDLARYAPRLAADDLIENQRYLEVHGTSNRHINEGALGQRGIDDALRSGMPGMEYKLSGYEAKGIGDGAAGADDWARNMGQYFTADGLAVTALQALRKYGHDPKFRPLAEAEVLAKLRQPELAAFRERAELAHVTPDGQRVVNAAQGEQALRDLARRHLGAVEALVMARNGGISPALIKYLEAGGRPSKNWIEKNVPLEFRPEHAIGRNWTPVLPGGGTAGGLWAGWTKFATKGYDMLVTKPTSWASRQPQYVGSYVSARKAMEPYEAMLVRNGMSAERAEALAHQHSGLAAAIDVTKRIDNPAVRSQAAMMLRNHWMFVRATEDFGRRWYRIIKEDPVVVVKAQLVVQGGIHSGVLDKDEEGNLIFTYPGSGAIINTLMDVAAVFPGAEGLANLPVSNDMTSRLTFLNPSLTNPVGFSANPLVSTTAKSVSSLVGEWFPSTSLSTQAIDRLMNGELGAGRAWYETYMPAPVAALYRAYDDDSAQSMSAARNALIHLSVADLLPPPNATATEKNDFLDRVKVSTENQLVARAVIAFFAPAAPGNPANDFGDPNPADAIYREQGIQSLKAEFRKMIDDWGFEKALGVWAELHPDELAFSYGGSTVGSDAFAPITIDSANWMNDNVEQLRKYRSAATFFIPEGSGDFSQVAYNTQLELGIRQSRDLGDLYDQVRTTNASKLYYSSKEDAEQAIAREKASGQTERAQAIESGWANWKASFFSANPLFEAQQNEFGARASQRKVTVEELRGLVEDEGATAFVGIGGAKQMLDAYDNYNVFQLKWRDERDTDSMVLKAQVAAKYRDFMVGVITDNPSLTDLYNSVFSGLD